MHLSYQLKGEIVKVIGVHFHDQHILHKLDNIGITKGTILKILDYDKSNSLLHLSVHGVEYVLRTKDCRYIDVQEYKEHN